MAIALKKRNARKKRLCVGRRAEGRRFEGEEGWAQQDSLKVGPLGGGGGGKAV